MLYLFGLVLALAAGQQPAVDLDNVVIPRKTDVFVSLERSLSSKSASAGDRFHARIVVPITIDDQIVVPAGSYLIGTVDDTRKPGFFRGKGELYLVFDTVILPNGTTRRLVGIVQSAEGHESGDGSREGGIVATGSQADEVLAESKDLGVLGGLVAGARAGSLKGFGVGAAVGAATGAILGLLSKGKDVQLPRGASLTIQLERDMGFVKPEKVPTGKPLKP